MKHYCIAKVSRQSIRLELLVRPRLAERTVTVTEWFVPPAGLQVYSPSSSSSTLVITILLRLELTILSCSRRTPPLWSLKSRGRPRMYLNTRFCAEAQIKNCERTVCSFPKNVKTTN